MSDCGKSGLPWTIVCKNCEGTHCTNIELQEHECDEISTEVEIVTSESPNEDIG